MSSERAAGDRYLLTEAERSAFQRDGWVKLPGFLREPELAALEQVYMALLRREIPVTGRDYCDMSGDYSRPIEDFGILNVMLPRRYYPALADNVYERRASDVARQLWGDDMVLDYDQFVAKPPHKEAAVFHWHQDLGYWPITEDTRTASFWLALDDTRLDNGCLRFVRGSHREPELRPHLPLHDDRGKSHTLVATVDESSEPLDVAELRRGDVIDLGHVRLRFVEPGEDFVLARDRADVFRFAALQSAAGQAALAEREPKRGLGGGARAQQIEQARAD